MVKDRLLHIDLIKGFAILLVVMGHIFVFTFQLESCLLQQIIASFHMPLFMFLSGYMVLSANKLSFNKNLKRKFVALILPFLTMGGLYVAIMNYSIHSLFFSEMKVGFWFVWVLFLLFCLYYPLHSLSLRFNDSKKWYIDLMLFGSVGIALETIRILGLLPDILSGFISLRQLSAFYRFFVMGMFCRKYIELNICLHSNNMAYTIMLLLYGLCFIANIYGHGNYMTIWGVGIAGVWCAYYFFYRYQAQLPLSRIMAFVGKRSLDIYLLHYFFLMRLETIPPYLLKYINKNIAIQIFISLLLASLIIVISLTVGQVVRSSNILAMICLGIRKNNK